MGEVPSWYRVVRAARYLGVAPWDLERAPMSWVSRAEAAMAAEQEARDKRQPKGHQHAG